MLLVSQVAAIESHLARLPEYLSRLGKSLPLASPGNLYLHHLPYLQLPSKTPTSSGLPQSGPLSHPQGEPSAFSRIRVVFAGGEPRHHHQSRTDRGLRHACVSGRHC